MSNKTYLMMLGSSLGVTLLAAFGATMPNIRAITQTASSTATVTVSATCSMTGNVVSEHSTTMVNGEYKENIGKTQLTTLCNDASGFSIYAIGYTGGVRGQTMLHSDTVGVNYDIQTGVSGSGSEWSMKVNTVSGTYTPSIDNGYNNYSIVPHQYTRVAYLGSSTSPTVGASVDTTYAVRTSQTQPAGTYVGQVKYILVHPSGVTPSEMLEMQDVATWGGTLLLNEEVTAVDTRDNQTYTVARLPICVPGYTTGDDPQFEQCLTTSSQLWMTQNLNFAPSAAVTYTYDDTDLGHTDNDHNAEWQPLASTMTSPAYITKFESGNPANSVEGWSNDYNLPHYAEGKYYRTATEQDPTSGFTNDEIIVYNGTKYVGMTACVNAGHTASQCAHYQVGNYYNWPAAIASNDATSISAPKQVAPNSVCPAGWRLPKGLTSDNTNTIQSEFNSLFLAAGITNTAGLTGDYNVGYTTDGYTMINTNPYYLVRSGRVNGTMLHDFASLGFYWSSTAVSGSLAYGLYYNSGGLYPAAQGGRDYGRSLRCVASIKPLEIISNIHLVFSILICHNILHNHSGE